LSESIWNFSSQGIQTIIQGIAKSPSLVGAKVLDERGNQWNSAFAPSDQAPGMFVYFDPKTGDADLNNKQSASHSFNYKEEIFFSDETGERIKIGTLILYSSSSIVFGQVRDAFIIILLNAAIKISALWALFLIYGYKLLTKPLNALTQATQAVRQGNFSNPDLPVASSWPTEIEILNDNFNVMTKDLSTAQSRLLEAQKRTRSIIDSMPSMIVGVSADHHITDWNAHMVDFTGVTLDAAQGKVFNEVAAEYQFLLETIDRSIKEKSIQRLEKQSIYHDNKRSFQDILIYPIALENELGAVVRMDDVTNRIQLEKVMSQNAKMSSVGTLAAGMAHQLSTPIGAISQGVQNIHRRLDPALEANKDVATEMAIDLQKVSEYLEKRKVTEFLTQVEHSVEDANKILNNLLAFSKPSTSVKSTVDLKTLLNHALELAKSDYDLTKKMDFAHTTVNLNMPESALNVYVASTDIEQALLSIIKYSAQNMQYIDRARSITVTASLEEGFVSLELRDNGPGLEAEVLSHVFDPFFTQKTQGEQIGMGLSVSYKTITEEHNGSMSIENAQPTGLVFKILLPVSSNK